MNTHFAIKARSQPLTAQQIAVVIGSMLGDGYLVKTTSGFAFRVNHSLKQKDYVMWKYKLLKDFSNSSPRQSGTCFYFRTITHPTFVQMHNVFYRNGRKVIPKKLLAELLDDLVLAVWIMDDGSRDGMQIRINSQCFNKAENEFLQKVLRTKLGIVTTLNRDKVYYRLRVAHQSMETIRTRVTPNLIPSMFYKLIP
ncbi:MAG: hypothetical protein A3F33_00875 [Candidatus Woykebacteria bacterium RIFCSPHIGHO2_12_FULL_43_10]|nr:MAG: hypothetical protein A3F33_00875 [Candidatus Woykebacteria bacterium RIFCSPHIGHO2_12_FULL_43_10]